MTDALKQAAQQMLSAIPKIRFDSLNMTLKDLAEIRDAALVLRAALAAPAPAAPQAGAAGETVSCKHGVRLPHECSDCFDETDWYSPTTHAKRIADVVQLLCSGNRPSDAVVEAWLSNPDDCRLQEFAIEHGPSWAQGIAVIDAARVLADQPTEGVAHEFAPQPAAPQAIDYTPGDWFMAHTVDEMQRFFRSRLPAIREAANACGYAIGVHGSERRDFDLIAMQWRDGADSADELAHEIARAACGISRAPDTDYEWETKPSGRIATSIPICWTEKWAEDMAGAGHIDLSVMPSTQPAQAVPLTNPCGMCRHADSWGVPLLKNCEFACHYEHINGIKQPGSEA